jgi:rhodanese-related sulfurtransferase
MPVKNLSAPELQKKLQANDPLFLLDVREPFEFNHVKIAGSVLIPLNTIPQRLSELDHNKALVLICHHGMRSLQAANFLDQVGFKDVSNLVGGIDAWSLECDTSLPRY